MPKRKPAGKTDFSKPKSEVKIKIPLGVKIKIPFDKKIKVPK